MQRRWDSTEFLRAINSTVVTNKQKYHSHENHNKDE